MKTTTWFHDRAPRPLENTKKTMRVSDPATATTRTHEKGARGGRPLVGRCLRAGGTLRLLARCRLRRVDGVGNARVLHLLPRLLAPVDLDIRIRVRPVGRRVVVV